MGSKYTVELTEEEMIRYYANKIVEDGLADTSEFSYSIDINFGDYEDNFVLNHKEQILDRMDKDERVAECYIDELDGSLNLTFWLDYCPYYFETNHLTSIQQIQYLKLFAEESLYPISKYAVNNTVRNVLRNFMDCFIERNNEIDFDEKDDIYYCIKEHLCNTGFIDKYIDKYEVFLNKDNTFELAESMMSEIGKVFIENQLKVVFSNGNHKTVDDLKKMWLEEKQYANHSEINTFEKWLGDLICDNNLEILDDSKTIEENVVDVEI